MNMPIKFSKPSAHKWMTLNVATAGDKFILEEQFHQHKTQQIVEGVFIVLVAGLLISAYLIFLLPWLPIASDYAAVGLGLLCIGTALALYAFGTRGHARQIGFDRRKMEIWLCKVNERGHARIITHISKKDVKSIYVRRPDAPGKDADLMARISGKAAPAVILRAPMADIQAAHDVLCEELRQGFVKPARVRLAARRQRKPQAGPVGDRGPERVHA